MKLSSYSQQLICCVEEINTSIISNNQIQQHYISEIYMVQFKTNLRNFVTAKMEWIITYNLNIKNSF